MDDSIFLAQYFDRYRKILIDDSNAKNIIDMHDVVQAANRQGKKIIFAGNGGSAAIASHCAVDYTKQGGIRSINFNESDLITCFANDYGYEHWVEKALEFYADSGDVVVLISASGKSPNMVNAARYAKQAGHTVITCTGFEEGNPLQSIGDINFWADSRAYNIIECIHQVWLLAVCDMLIGKAEYSVN